MKYYSLDNLTTLPPLYGNVRNPVFIDLIESASFVLTYAPLLFQIPLGPGILLNKSFDLIDMTFIDKGVKEDVLAFQHIKAFSQIQVENLVNNLDIYFCADDKGMEPLREHVKKLHSQGMRPLRPLPSYKRTFFLHV